MPSATLYRAHLVTLAGKSSLDDARQALVDHEDGALLVDGRGRILAAGAFGSFPIPDGTLVETHRHGVILPGFVDTHLHFPQVFAQDGFGGGELLEWLDRCIFPAEALLADPVHAASAARHFCAALVRAGTTTALVFGSEFEAAEEALFAELARRGLRAIVGRTAMVQGPASAASLLTSEDDAIRLARREIDRWHPRAGRDADALLQVALVPRFALSMTRTALRRFGELFEEVRDRGVYVTTHLSENAREADGEVALVQRSFGVDHYLDVYDGRFEPGGRRGGPGLLSRRTILAHAVHCSDDEYRRIAAAGAAIAHCPVSQLFLGSGTMPWKRVRAAGIEIGLGSDVGAGDCFSIAEVANAAYKVHLSAADRSALHPAELLHLMTLGGARTLDLEARIGSLEAGKDADFALFVPDDDELLAARLCQARARGREAWLFALLHGLGRVTPRDVFVRGRRVGPTDDGAAK